MDAWINDLLGSSMELTIAVRILLALILGGVVGFEREYFGRTAGFRTHILVSLGAALVMTISIYGFEGGDPARLAAQVISGIGFIGAGAIIHSEKDIKGLTTAATLWITAMIGLAAGNGFYFGAIITTLFAIVVLVWFRNIERKINKKSLKLKAVILWEEGLVSKVLELLKEYNLTTYAIESKKVKVNNEEYLRMYIIFQKDSLADSMKKFTNKLQEVYNPIELKVMHE